MVHKLHIRVVSRQSGRVSFKLIIVDRPADVIYKVEAPAALLLHELPHLCIAHLLPVDSVAVANDSVPARQLIEKNDASLGVVRVAKHVVRLVAELHERVLFVRRQEPRCTRPENGLDRGADERRDVLAMQLRRELEEKVPNDCGLNPEPLRRPDRRVVVLPETSPVQRRRRIKVARARGREQEAIGCAFVVHSAVKRAQRRRDDVRAARDRPAPRRATVALFAAGTARAAFLEVTMRGPQQ
mmetsp:Transcript_9474/g.24076  ORF Transcript_9474/g.24076 Transcript_9474/m.24076 type:complete len:242 (+) Transcript_9474:276-1001(+)